MINKLVEKYEKRGVKLWVENNNLRYKAPVGILQDEDFKELRQFKKDLIDYFNKENQVTSDIRNRYEKFPITDIQSAYLVGRNDAYESGGIGCHSYVEFEMPVLDRKRLESAWHSLINRHDMLRAIVMADGYQQVLEYVDMPTLKEQDLRGLSEEEITRKIHDVRAEYSNKCYKTDKWPLHEFFLSTFEDKSILHCSMDMLIGDFVSVNIIFNELLHYYYNPDSKLEDLDVTYRDILMFLKERKKSNKFKAKLDKDKEYWLDKLKNFPEAPELPAKKERINGEVKFNRLHFSLSQEKWNALSKRSMKSGVTPSGIVLAAFSEVIRRWSKQDRFCINITLMNRPSIHPQIKNIVGDFTSVDVLEVSSKSNSTFIERAKNLQQRLWDDLDHSDFSGVEVLRELSRQKNKNVIIPVVYTGTIGIDNEEKSESDANSFLNNVEMLYGISQTPQVWIDCQASEVNKELHINWDVRCGVLPDGMPEAAFEAYRLLLEKIAVSDEILNEISVVELPNNIVDVRNSINNTSAPISSGLIHDGFVNNVKNNPDNIAIISEGKEYSYSKVAEYSESVCKELLARGVNKGDYILVVQHKGVWQIASILGILLAGASYVPVDVSQPKDRICEIIETSKAKYVLSDKKNLIFESAENINVKDLKVMLIEELTNLEVDNEQPAYVIFTSGSTGKPKGVVISHKAARNTIDDINNKFNVSSEDKIINLSSIAFDLAVYDIFGILQAGGTLVIPDAGHERDPKHWIDLISKNRITLWNSVPALMTMLISYLRGTKENITIPELRLALLSGDWIPVTLPEKVWNSCTNIKLISLGGATEAAIWSIYYPITEISKDMISIPYGIPLQNQQFYILNKKLEICPDWVTGDIYIAGEGLAIEYLGDEKLTNESFIYHKGLGKRLYRTGDVGKYRSDGIIEFEGREDTQVKVNGHRIELSEIETVLQNYDEIENAVVVTSGKSSNNQSLSAYVQPKKLKEVSKNLGMAEKIKNTVYKIGEEALKDVDRDVFLKWLDYSAITPLADIMDLFNKSGLFKEEDSTHSFEEIISSINADQKHTRLIKRWLNALCKEKFLKFNKTTGKYLVDGNLAKIKDRESCWLEYERLENKLQYSRIYFDYLKKSSESLTELLNGNMDALDLFFPKGEYHVALAAYRDNLINRTLNTVTHSAVMKIIEEHEKLNENKPFRILEVGAGVGGTTTELLPLLKGHNVSYYFTDVSTFFFNEAKTRFKEYDFVKYGLFDINQNYWEQGLSAFSFDLILCCNVLHNSKNAPKVLSILKELSVPGGNLVVIEATKESYSLLTSLEFKEGLSGYTDSRAENDKTFFSRNEWEHMFKEANIEILCEYPKADDPIVECGQSVFVNKFNEEVKYVDVNNVKKHLQSKVPEYMVPNHIEVIPEIPITSNGKVDRKKLIERELSIIENNSVIGQEPTNELEKKIAKIWCDVLNKEKIYIDENFYTAGGDSLLIAQVVAKMSEELEETNGWNWDDLMREILRKPTVQGIAGVLINTNKINVEGTASIEQIKKDNNQNSSLVLFSQSKKENAPLKAVFHAGTGTLTAYNELLKELVKDKNYTVVGFVFGDEEEYLSYSTKTLITDLARKYADSLLEYNAPRYELIGYCVGGWIALETARILLEEGKDVELVNAISTSLPTHKIDNEVLMERAFARMLGVDLSKIGYVDDDDLLREALKELILADKLVTDESLCNLSGKYEELGKLFKKLLSTTHEERLKKIFESVETVEDKGSSIKMLNIIYKIFNHTFKGVMEYRPDVYVGDVQVLKPADKTTHFFPKVSSENENLWQNIVIGDFKEKEIKGTHLSCMQNADLIRSLFKDE